MKNTEIKKFNRADIEEVLIDYAANCDSDWFFDRLNEKQYDDINYICHEYEAELEALPDDNWEEEDEKLMKKHVAEIEAILA